MKHSYLNTVLACTCVLALSACQDRRDNPEMHESDTPAANVEHNATGSTTIENVTPNPDAQRNVSSDELREHDQMQQQSADMDSTTDTTSPNSTTEATSSNTTP